ncbi:hypothetical protein ALC62_11780 [Cyphomyrmex costatus]|uniref:Uncharacterized protein n=1 Tax=Cyphomyrmex costatus TaxID=456900 RepID=A0A195CBK0_9HYME|nr:hypothetical protein ALC62_11780 [Cyphomyrmex costatus]
MVDRGLTLAVLPPSPRQGTAITYATRSTMPTTPTRTTTNSPGEVERDARNAYVVYFEARAIRAGVIFSSAMHGRRYSRREQSANRLAPEERASRGKAGSWNLDRERLFSESTVLSVHYPATSRGERATWLLWWYTHIVARVHTSIWFQLPNRVGVALCRWFLWCLPRQTGPTMRERKLYSFHYIFYSDNPVSGPPADPYTNGYHNIFQDLIYTNLYPPIKRLEKLKCVSQAQVHHLDVTASIARRKGDRLRDTLYT